MTRESIIRMAHGYLLQYGLLEKGWKFIFTKSYKSLGQCRYDTKEIAFSEKWREAPLVEIRDTILHEIAHALTGPGHGHDLKWKKNCIKIGAKPNRLHDSTIPGVYNPSKYKWHCDNCGKNFYRVRKPNTAYFCCLKDPEDPNTGSVMVLPEDWIINPNYVK